MVEMPRSDGALPKKCGAAQTTRSRRLVPGQDPCPSAGVTVMAAFPKDKRWLTLDAALLIHGRRMVKDLHLEGPLGSCRRVLEERIADIDQGLRLEERGFAELIDGSNVDAEEAGRRAYGGWYLSAEEAFSRGLVAGLV